VAGLEDVVAGLEDVVAGLGDEVTGGLVGGLDVVVPLLVHVSDSHSHCFALSSQTVPDGHSKWLTIPSRQKI